MLENNIFDKKIKLIIYNFIILILPLRDTTASLRQFEWYNISPLLSIDPLSSKITCILRYVWPLMLCKHLDKDFSTFWTATITEIMIIPPMVIILRTDEDSIKAYV
mgnify:CR=1 FL=1